MTPRERHDLPYVIGLAIAVVIVLVLAWIFQGY